jgi:hypothetical protein
MQGAYKRSSKSHSVIGSKAIQDFANIFFKGFCVSRLKSHQFILHFVPQFFKESRGVEGTQCNSVED